MSKLKPNQILLDGHLITEIPLLFQTEMVKANMEDRKTQTRRTKLLENYTNQTLHNIHKVNGVKVSAAFLEEPENIKLIRCSYGKPGDLLWVRETHAHTKILNLNPEDENYGWVYKADGQPWEDYEGFTWKPSIHMPKSASRIWAMVEEIKVERVQDISEEDAKAEGVKVSKSGKFYFNYIPGYEEVTQFVFDLTSAKDSYRSLWQAINGRNSWLENPWVWVIRYRILSKTGRPSEEVILKNHLEITGQLTN